MRKNPLFPPWKNRCARSLDHTLPSIHYLQIFQGDDDMLSDLSGWEKRHEGAGGWGGSTDVLFNVTA